MPPTHIAYYAFMIVALLCASMAARKQAYFYVISALLIFSITTEMIVDVLKAKGIEHHIMYHIYIPAEYSLLALFFARQRIAPHVKRYILLSIPVFIVASAIISLFIIQPPHFPSVQFNAEGLLIIVISVYTLFAIEADDLTPFHTFPIFWICSGIILFHTGLFLFNGAYNYLLSNQTREAKHLHSLINTNLQYLLYLFWIIGFLCRQRKRSFIIH